ncbi:MAG: hypothetical protein J6C46_09375 [Clostridia bacterium]|nr:hypothetical protein [Clostridia bacterium]
MFLLKFAQKYNFAIMQKNGIEHVFEDFFSTSSNAFCIADGITRDLTSGEPFIYPKTLDEALTLTKNYPNPSGAGEVAHICAESFVKCASLLDGKKLKKHHIHSILKLINHEIYKINKPRVIDYIANDLYCCVAVGGIFSDNILYCFAIGDSKITMLDENLNVVFDTSDSSETNSYKYSFSLRRMNKTSNWNEKRYRTFIRKKIRNNLFLKTIKRYTFGALTGEQRCLKFVKTYSVPLDNVKYILAYSDGCEECLQTKDQIRSVLSNPEQIAEEMHEKTLIIYEKEN